MRMKLAPTGRGAMRRLKGAIYATINREKLDLDKSRAYWGALARELVELMNREGISNYPTRINLYYVVEDNALKPVFVEIEYARAPLEKATFTVEYAEEE